MLYLSAPKANNSVALVHISYCAINNKPWHISMMY